MTHTNAATKIHKLSVCIGVAQFCFCTIICSMGQWGMGFEWSQRHILAATGEEPIYLSRQLFCFLFSRSEEIKTVCFMFAVVFFQGSIAFMFCFFMHCQSVVVIPSIVVHDVRQPVFCDRCGFSIVVVLSVQFHVFPDRKSFFPSCRSSIYSFGLLHFLGRIRNNKALALKSQCLCARIFTSGQFSFNHQSQWEGVFSAVSLRNPQHQKTTSTTRNTLYILSNQWKAPKTKTSLNSPPWDVLRIQKWLQPLVFLLFE